MNENNYDAYENPKYRKEFSATWKPANKPRRTDQWVNQRTEFGNDAKMHKIVRGEVGKPIVPPNLEHSFIALPWS